MLARVYDANGLAERGIDEEAFANGFNIQSYIPDYDLILRKYRVAVARKRITSGESKSCRKGLRVEIEQASNDLRACHSRPAMERT